MPSLAQWQPLRQETIDTIRARIDANVNAGLDESDARWQETTEGGFFYDLTQSGALELEMLWDFASTELPASFFLPFSWGIYLDYWGELLNVPRKTPVAATGEVRLTNSSTEPQTIARGLEVAAPATTPEDSPITFQTAQTVTIGASASVLVAVEATDVGTAYNVSSGAISLITSPSQELAVTNDDPVSGGEDEELDQPYKTRLLLEFQGSRGGGTKDDYIAQTLALGSVGNVVVQPHWSGPNTVRLIIADSNNQPLSPQVIEEVQAFWDPSAESGLGAGEAPIDAEVSVATVTITTASIKAKLELEPGFTLSGAGGTVNVTEAVETVLRAYFHSLQAGARVQLNRVLSALISIEGVYDVHVGTLQINGKAEDLVVSALHSAQLGSVELESEAAP